MLRLLVLMLLLSSCKHPIFSGKSKKKEVPVATTNDEDSNKKIVNPNDNNQDDKDNPGQGGEEVLNLIVTNLKHDALYKNCLEISINDESYEMVACNKDFDKENQRVYTRSFSGDQCVELKFRISTFEPVNKQTCISAIQANRQNHSCDYNSTPMRRSELGDNSEQRFEINQADGSSEKILDIGYEDSNDRDWNDLVFRLDLSSLPRVSTPVYNTCTD